MVARKRSTAVSSCSGNGDCAASSVAGLAAAMVAADAPLPIMPNAAAPLFRTVRRSRAFRAIVFSCFVMTDVYRSGRSWLDSQPPRMDFPLWLTPALHFASPNTVAPLQTEPDAVWWRGPVLIRLHLGQTSSGGRERWHCLTGSCYNPYGAVSASSSQLNINTRQCPLRVDGVEKGLVIIGKP
jgi:hypothetical protein